MHLIWKTNYAGHQQGFRVFFRSAFQLLLREFNNGGSFVVRATPLCSKVRVLRVLFDSSKEVSDGGKSSVLLLKMTAACSNVIRS